MFATHPQKWKSNIGNSRYHKKIPKMNFDNWSNLLSLEKGPGMSPKSEIYVEIRVVQFLLKFPTHTQK